MLFNTENYREQNPKFKLDKNNWNSQFNFKGKMLYFLKSMNREPFLKKLLYGYHLHVFQGKHISD